MNSRIETKYILNLKSFHYLKVILPTLFEVDPYSHEIGYQVRSLYFDDQNFKAFYDKEEGELYKEKWRLRLYDGDLSTLRIEKKTKHGRISSKSHHELEVPFHLLPRLIVQYRRLAFEQDDLRLTLDFDLSFDYAQTTSAIEASPLEACKSDCLLLEVKAQSDNSYPALEKIIHTLGLKSSAFSKYSEGMKHFYDL